MADNPLLHPGRDLLLARGYQPEGRPGDHVYTRVVAPGVTGFVWFNAVVRSKFVDFSPKVGLRHEELRRWVTELAALSQPQRSTLWRSLYGLHPVERPADASIVVRGEEERNAVFWDWVAAQLDNHGEPWMSEHAAPDRLAESLRNLEAGPLSRVTLPVLLWLSGDSDGAHDAVEWGRSLKVNGGPTVDYDAFAARLFAAIDASPCGPPN